MSRDLLDENDHLPPAVSPAPTNIPAGNHASSAIPFDRNNSVPAPAPAPGTPSVSVAPASSEGNIPANGTLNPNAPTPAPSTVGGKIPAVGTPTVRNDDAAPPAKGSSTAPASQIDRNNVTAAPASQIDRNKVTAAPAAGGPITPTSRLDRSDNIPAGAAPTIPQDQTEKVKRLGGKRKQKGKAQRKERRRHHQHHHHGRRRAALGDL